MEGLISSLDFIFIFFFGDRFRMVGFECRRIVGIIFFLFFVKVGECLCIWNKCSIGMKILCFGVM